MRKLNESEKLQIKEMIDKDMPLPVQFQTALFPNGAFDQTAWDRATSFNRGFKQLRGTEWTTSHFAPKEPIPPANVQAAWPWRREIWTLKFVCRRSLGRAYCRYMTGEWAEWSDAQRELERLCHLTNALTAHNGIEDRIAQLANCFSASPTPEDKVHFCKLFKENAPAPLPKTTAFVAVVRADADWQAAHGRANTIKHRWTGEVMSQLPPPATVRQHLSGQQTMYVCYGTLEIKPDDIDRICESIQRSLNLLIDLATTLDQEIGWERYFHIADDERTPR